MLPALIAAGGSLLSNVLGNSANNKARAREYEQQKEFAQSGIQWKVEDAKKAGIHPLYALGANTVSYSPQSVGGSDFSGLAQAGQNIGRAIDATRDGSAKAQALATTLANIQIEGAQLDNDIKRASLNSAMATNRPMQTPNMPGTNDQYFIPGQGNTPVKNTGIELEKKIAPAHPTLPHTEYGEVPEIQWARTATGWAPTIPQALSESYENDITGRTQWQFRNKLGPTPGSMGGTNSLWQPPAHVKLKHGQRWFFNTAMGEWQIQTGFRDHFVPRHLEMRRSN